MNIDELFVDQLYFKGLCNCDFKSTLPGFVRPKKKKKDFFKIGNLFKMFQIENIIFAPH